MRAQVLVWGLFLLVGSSTGVALRAADAPVEMQGNWRVMGLVIDGQVVHEETKPGRELAGFSLLVNGNRLTYTMLLSNREGRAEFEIVDIGARTETRPRPINVRLLNGIWKDQVCLGMYELDGDSLKLCLADKPGTPRPATMQAKAGSGHQALTLRRAKPVAQSP